MIRALGYTLAFCLMLAFCLVLLYVALFALIAVLAFITWSLPIASVFSWPLFRLFLSVSAVMAVFFCTSKEGREFVSDFEEGYNRGRR